MQIDTLTLSLARLCGALFAGACLYIVIVEQPARLAARTLEAITQFRLSIARAERMQPTLLLATLSLLAATLLTREAPLTLWVGGGLLFSILPFSFAWAVPINRRLLAGTADEHREEGMRLITRWGRLHALRSALACVGTLLLFS